MSTLIGSRMPALPASNESQYLLINELVLLLEQGHVLAGGDRRSGAWCAPSPTSTRS